jgi:hypothetical protein
MWYIFCIFSLSRKRTHERIHFECERQEEG